MTQITEEQKQQLQAAAERVAAKLVAFHDGLPADEQIVLDVAFGRLVDGEEPAMGEEVDARGHMIKQDRVQPGPEGTGGGGGFPNRFAHNVKTLFEPIIDNLPNPF
ncbi:MAG: hypothetical protein ACRDJE_20235 [Dehalococcoidia bacterium]